MRKKSEITQITSANLAAWDEAAPVHARHNQTHLLQAFSQPGFSCLDDIETSILKQLKVSGKDVAQVCCNNGRELICVKNMGAKHCVGFDGAKGFIDQARDLAAAAGQDIKFVCCDIYDIPSEFHGRFDLVTITIGVLGWMPDIDAFFAVIQKLLRPGGAIFIYEHHPITVMIEPAPEGAPIVWELSYFRTDPYVEKGGLDYYGGDAYDASPVTSFSHKMSDIIMAGVKSDLAVEHFEELPHHISNTWWNVENSGIGLPMCYTLVFRKAG